MSRLLNVARLAGRLIGGALTLRLARYEIVEESMAPALSPGDWVLGIRRPRVVDQGSVVVVEHPHRPGFLLVKRVAPPPPGLPEGHLWLLGDDPEAGSVDSRALGPFPLDRVRALLLLRYHPRPFRGVTASVPARPGKP